MDWISFIEKMTSHLAWPLTILAVASLFRSEVRGFIGRIRNAKYAGVELDLEEEIQQIKRSAEDAGITIHYSPASLPEDSVARIGDAPEWAFIRSWQELEELVDQLYSETFSGDEAGRPTARAKINRLRESGTVDKRLAEIVQALQETRNRIVHEPSHSVTRGEALEWLGISKSVADRLRQLIRSAV